MSTAAAARRMSTRVRRVGGSPVVSLRLWLWGGSRTEPVPGLAWVTGRMLSEGTTARDWRAIAEECESTGMMLGSFGGLEVHGLAIDCLSRDWRHGLALLEELVQSSSFPEERCRWVCTQGVAELESLDDQPDAKAAWAFSEQLYAPHPSGRPRPGTRASLAAIGPDDCRALHAGRAGRGGVLVVTGDLDEEAAQRAIAESFTCDPASSPSDPPEPAACDGMDLERREVATVGRDQAHLFMGHLTVALSHPDVPALEVASIVLGAGAGLSGRIPERVREREGLAYSASAAIVAGAGLDPGRLVAHVATSPATVARAETCVREEIARFVAEGMSDAEFEEARSYLLRREPFRRETARQWAGLMAQSALYGQPLDDADWVADRYRSLDRAAVEASVRRHLRPGQLKLTLGLPA